MRCSKSGLFVSLLHHLLRLPALFNLATVPVYDTTILIRLHFTKSLLSSGQHLFIALAKLTHLCRISSFGGVIFLPSVVTVIQIDCDTKFTARTRSYMHDWQTLGQRLNEVRVRIPCHSEQKKDQERTTKKQKSEPFKLSIECTPTCIWGTRVLIAMVQRFQERGIGHHRLGMPRVSESPPIGSAVP